jgi:hypothetical protein
MGLIKIVHESHKLNKYIVWLSDRGRSLRCDPALRNVNSARRKGQRCDEGYTAGGSSSCSLSNSGMSLIPRALAKTTSLLICACE